MSQLLDQEGLTNIRILSLDTATHDCMNVRPMKLWNFLLDIARSGRLIALLLRPAVRWSSARFEAMLAQPGAACSLGACLG